MPTISIIIPAYNTEHTIIETITSVQRQTFSDFEIIVINDGSTDGTLEVIKTIKEPRLKVFSYENCGVSSARNHGISQAKGEFIAFLDADDLWTPDKLELQLAALQKKPEIGVAYSWIYNMGEKGEFFQVGHQVFFEGNVLAELLISNFLANGSNPLIRKQAIESVGKFDSTLTYGEDWEFYLRLAVHWSFVVVPKPQILYRQSSSAATTKVEVMEERLILLTEKLFQVAPQELQYLKKQSLANTYQYLAGMYLARVNDFNSVKQASKKLKMAIGLYPKILLNRITLRYVMKCLIMQLLSPKIAKYFTKAVSKTREMGDPRLKQESP
jgi:glycosyltransferase involved in cell wall biosynthesis